MKLGVAYYPEHDHPEQWAADLRKMTATGIRMIRIAEFAWTVIEPRDGEYRWEWLDQAIDRAGEYGIQAVLCTPTACPPIWLAERYPEILPVNKEGKTIGFGARQHRSYHSGKYMEYALRITRLMGERYGSHPNVIAWQLDNEFGGETKYDYGECARSAFHAWLAEKYGTIDSLNERWGTTFWSQRYERFDQIPLPAPIGSDVKMWHHPSLVLDFARFSSAGMSGFARKQAETLRPLIGGRPITTNAFMFSWGDNLDWTELFSGLDVVGMDIYSDRPHEIAFYCDASRSVLSKPFWMLEYGASAAELERDMNIVRERGCSRFFLFKWKPFPWGQEQGKGTPELLTLTGESSPNMGIVKRYSEEHGMEEELTEHPRAKIGLYYHFASSWSNQLSVWDPVDYPDYLVHTVYRCLFDRGEKVEVVYTPDRIQGLDVLIVPLHNVYDAALEREFRRFVREGGRLIATSDLFRKNEDNVFLTRVPAVFAETFGWRENNFVPDIRKEENEVLLTAESGSGKTWLVSRGLSYEQWDRLLDSVCGC